MLIFLQTASRVSRSTLIKYTCCSVLSFHSCNDESLLKFLFCSSFTSNWSSWDHQAELLACLHPEWSSHVLLHPSVYMIVLYGNCNKNCINNKEFSLLPQVLRTWRILNISAVLQGTIKEKLQECEHTSMQPLSLLTVIPPSFLHQHTIRHARLRTGETTYCGVCMNISVYVVTFSCKMWSNVTYGLKKERDVRQKERQRQREREGKERAK